MRLVLAERVLQRADVERSPDALAHRGQAEEHGKRPILDHQAQEDANPLNSFCCVKLTDQDEEEGDKGADEEGHLELGEVVPPQLFYEQVEKNEGKEGEEAENEEDNLDVSLSSRVVLLLTEVEAVAFVWFQKNWELWEVSHFSIYDHSLVGQVKQVGLVDDARLLAMQRNGDSCEGNFTQPVKVLHPLRTVRAHFSFLTVEVETGLVWILARLAQLGHCFIFTCFIVVSNVYAKSVIWMRFLVDHIEKKNPFAGVVHFELRALKDVAWGGVAPRPLLFQRNFKSLLQGNLIPGLPILANLDGQGF